MDIRQAKEALRYMVRAYTERDETGQLCIPQLRQRPALLMGAPGIGKTAILSQLAEEEDIALVAYTMTHHTRQSALGLPQIRQRDFGGKPCAVTEYTMSEILAAVYDRMAETGQTRGILFLDEINCVSETLMPAILQLLQTKQFGTHRLPEGFVIVAAGNPPRYNQSARLFDTATMDRVRLMEIEENYDAWRDYACARGVHPAVLAYLSLNPEHFYCAEPHAHGRSFVTARGWEDLSTLLLSYERLGFPVGDALFGEYLQHVEIAASFAAFFRLFTRCRDRLDVAAVLSGAAGGCVPELRALRFDGRLAAIEFLLHALGRALDAQQREARCTRSLASFLAAGGTAAEARARLAQRARALAVRRDCGALSPEEDAAERRFAALVRPLLEGASDLAPLRSALAARERADAAAADAFAAQLDHALAFVPETFGAGQELLIFLTQLALLPGAEPFLRQNPRCAALRRELE